MLGLGLGGIAVTLCGSPFGRSMSGSSDILGIILGPGMFLFTTLIFTVSLVLLVLALRQPGGREFALLRAERYGWQRQLVSPAEWQAIVAKFGDPPSEQYKDIFNTRVAYISPLLGGDFQEYLR